MNKLTEKEAKQIFNLLQTDLFYMAEIARLFRVSTEMIRQIADGLAWKSVTGGVVTNPHKKLYEAFGEFKTLQEWSEDPRLTTTRSSFFQSVRDGYRIEISLVGIVEFKASKRLQKIKLLRQKGFKDKDIAVSLETVPSGIYRAANNHQTGSGSRSILREAFGEKKTASQWSKDPRCKVSYLSLNKRLKNGWGLEEALLTPLPVGDRVPVEFHCMRPLVSQRLRLSGLGIVDAGFPTTLYAQD